MKFSGNSSWSYGTGLTSSALTWQRGGSIFFKKIIEPGTKEWKPYPGKEFDRSEFRVDVDEQK